MYRVAPNIQIHGEHVSNIQLSQLSQLSLSHRLGSAFTALTFPPADGPMEHVPFGKKSTVKNPESIIPNKKGKATVNRNRGFSGVVSRFSTSGSTPMTKKVFFYNKGQPPTSRKFTLHVNPPSRYSQKNHEILHIQVNLQGSTLMVILMVIKHCKLGILPPLTGRAP